MPIEESPLTRLCRTMSQLRSPGGCPWDLEQTPESLKPYIVEEAYELLDAIDSGEPRRIKEELGDLLLQVVFQADIHRQKGQFDINDVIACIDEKLIRRHPHVFSEEPASTKMDHEIRWDRIKATENRSRPSGGILAGVPRHLPALQAAQKIHAKLKCHGHEQLFRESSEGSGETAGDDIATEPGRSILRALLEIVIEAERHGIDAEDLLRQYNAELLASCRSLAPRDPAQPPGAEDPINPSA